jgi:hypothetical protein
MRGLRRLKALLLAAVTMAMVVGGGLYAVAEGGKTIRIGTGSTGGTYFPVGGMIANAISNPPGSLACDLGGSCGVPGLIAGAVSTQGSVANVIGVANGTLDLALSQADVAYAAFFGKGVFAETGPLDNLRSIANLFPESVHLMVRRDSGIVSVADLKGKRVNLGEPESGTRVVAEIILKAYGVTEKDITAHYEKLGKAGDMLAADELDAVFMVGGDPMQGIVLTAELTNIDLLLISGPVAETIIESHPFFSTFVIPDGTYQGVGNIETLSVGAQLVVAESMDADLVYGITRALWNPANRRVLDSGHPNGQRIQLKSALDGIAIPLHPGAARYYEEIGLTRAGVF